MNDRTTTHATLSTSTTITTTTTTMTMTATRTRLATLAAAALLAACGGGDDASPAGSSSGSTPVALAPFVVSAANPSGYNGSYSKTNAQVEAGSSNAAMTTFNAGDDHCRVGIYTLQSAGRDYYVEMSFRKDSRAVGRLNYGTGVNTLLASATGPLAGVAVDLSNRRIGFNNVVLVNGSVTVTLNGSLEYTANVAPANQAACG